MPDLNRRDAYPEKGRYQINGWRDACLRTHLEGRLYQIVNRRYACQSMHPEGRADQHVSACMPEDASRVEPHPR
jgi:hypothetical protein